LAEGYKRSLGSVRLCRLQGNVMSITGAAGMAFSCPVSLAHDGAVRSSNREANLGAVHGQKGTAGLTPKKAFGLERLAIPTIEAKDAVGLGYGEPALDIAEFLTVSDAAADVPECNAAAKGANLLLGEAHQRTLT